MRKNWMSSNILFIAPRLHTNQLGIIDMLTKRGYTVYFLVVAKAADDPDNVIQIPIAEITYKIYSSHRYQDISSFFLIAIPKIKEFYRILKSLNPDIIILREGFLPYCSKLTLLLNLWMHARIVLYTQDPKYYTKSLRGYKVYLASIITKMLGLKWYTPVLYRGCIHPPLEHKDIIYIPFCPLEINIASKYYVGTFNILIIGKYTDRKNIMMTIKVFENLLKIANNNIHLTVVGQTWIKEREEYYDKCRLYIEQNNLTDKITLKKNIPHKDMEDIYRNSSVFILPALNEPASISQIEAMSYGLPVICSSDNGTAHYVLDNKTGFVIYPDEENIYNTLCKYINDKDLLIAHSKNAINHIKQNYSYQCVFEHFSKIL